MAKAQFNRALTKNDIDEIRVALTFYYPQVVGEKGRLDPGKFSTKNFAWSGRVDFDDDILFLTDVDLTNVREDQIYQTLKVVDQNLGKLTDTNPVESNRPTKEQLETLKKKAEERKISQQKAAEDANTHVKAAAKKQQELAEATKKAKVYVKTETPKPVALTQDQTKSIEILKSAAKANPQKLTRDLAQVIGEKVKSSLPSDVPQEEANLIYKQTAYRIVTNLQGNSLAKESLIENSISRDIEVLPKIITDKDTLTFFKYSGQSVSDAKLLEYKLTRQITSAAFGEALTNNVFGPENLGDIKVELSATPKENFEPYDLSQIPNQYSDSLNNGGSFIGHLKSFEEGEIRSQFLSQAGTWLDTKIASLPADSLLAQTYNTEFVQGALTYFGLGNPVAWEGTTFLGRIAIENGLGPALGWAQNLTGINFGISKAVSAVTTEVVGDAVATTAATEVGAEVVAGTVGATVGTGAGIAIGQVVIPVPVVGAALGAAVTWVATKIAKIIPWQKIKDNLIAISGGMLAAGLLVFPGTVFGTVLSVGGGLGLVGGVVNGGLSGLGSSLSGIGAGIGSFFGALGGAFFGEVGMPILVTILVFPVVVALILFIINAGAYVVPPSTALEGLQNPYIDIQKKPNPEGPFNNSDIPNKTKIEYTITVSAKQGPLTNIAFKDECKVIKKGTPPSCPPPSQGTPAPPNSISPSSPFSFTYTVNIASHDYDDSAIVDTFTVTADTPEVKGVTSASSASIVIGKPPMECPNNAWPLANDEGLYAVTQGSMTPLGWTHHNTPNAIDIGVNGATVIATHGGTATIGESACGGKWVEIASSCGGVSFYSYYGHLGATTVATGQKVTVGQTIAISDNTGSCSTGPHLHFQFFPTTNTIPATQKPYLKRDIPIGCTNQPGNLCN